MEDLTKQQLILMTLLVSFVTSIATGIVTVSLLEEESQGVTQTVNRVVERTIEKVVQAPAQGAAVITKETVVVKADDVTVEAVEKTSKSVARLYKNVITETGSVDIFVGLGLVVDKNGVIVADKGILGKNYYAILPEGEKISVEVIADVSSKNSVLKYVKGDSKENLPVFQSVSFGDSDSLKLGQSVILIAGTKENYVATGIIASLKKGIATTTPSVESIETDILEADIPVGSPIVNLSGEVVGVRTISGNYLPSAFIKFAISNIPKQSSLDFGSTNN